MKLFRAIFMELEEPTKDKEMKTKMLNSCTILYFLFFLTNYAGAIGVNSQAVAYLQGWKA